MNEYKATPDIIFKVVPSRQVSSKQQALKVISSYEKAIKHSKIKKGKSMDLKSKFDKIAPIMSNPISYATDKLINNKLIGKNKYIKATLKTLRGYESRDMLNIINESIGLLPSSIPGVSKAKVVIPRLASAYTLMSRIASNIEDFEKEEEEVNEVDQFLILKEAELNSIVAGNNGGSPDNCNFTCQEVDEHFNFPKVVMDWFLENGQYGENLRILHIWNAKTHKLVSPSEVTKQTDRLMLECYWNTERLHNSEVGNYFQNNVECSRFYIELRPQNTWGKTMGYDFGGGGVTETKYKPDQFWNLDGQYINHAWANGVLTLMRMEYLKTLDLNNNIVRISRFGNFELLPRAKNVTFVYDNIAEWGGTNQFVEKVNSALNAGKRYGAMLVGNPGTGKTSVINHIQARISDYPIVYVSPEDLTYLSTTIEQLLPCVAVFEDIESFDIQHKASKNTATMLSILDGSRYPGLVCIASVNNTSLLTPAIVRTGRFDDIIEVHEPRTRKAMYEIIKHYIESDEGYDAASISKLLPWTLYYKLRYVSKVTCSDIVGMVESSKLQDKVVNATTLKRAYKSFVMSRKVVAQYSTADEGPELHKRKKFLGIF